MIADVGENKYEELNLGTPGANYGWPTSEGPDNLNTTFQAPLFYYGRSNNPNTTFNSCRSITGGAYKRGSNFPTSYDNSYIFGDYTCGKLWVLNRTQTLTATNPSLFASDVGGPVTIKFGPDGAIYWSDINNGSIRKIKNTTTNPRCTPLGDINCTGKVDTLDLSYLLSKNSRPRDINQ